MRAVAGKVKSFLSNTFYQGENSNLKYITRTNLPFFICWIAIIFWLDCYALPIGVVSEAGQQANISPTSIFSYLYPLAGAAIICLFDLRKLLISAKFSAMVATIVILTGIVFDNAVVSYFGIALAAIALGHIVASTDYGFFMIMNNLERLYSVSIGIIVSKLIFLLKVNVAGSSSGVKFFEAMQIFGILVILVCVWFYQKSSYQEHFASEKKPHIRNYTVLVLACFVFLFNDFFAPALWRSGTATPMITLNTYHVAGVILGIIFTIVLQQVLRCNICYVLNFSFALLTMGFVMGALELQSIKLILLRALLFGISYSMGFVSIYYMLGIIAKRSRSMFFLRIGILSSAVFYIFGFFITGLLKDVSSQSLYSAIAIVSIAVILVIFALTPLLTELFYSAEWTDDLYRPDVTHVSRLVARLSEFKLSNREIDVCCLLLEGYTMRQISAMLSIKYSTVNTYCTSIYRKMEISSRTELAVMFSEYLSKVH